MVISFHTRFACGQEWQTFPDEPNGFVNCLLMNNTDLYVAGDFTLPYNGLAKWDGQEWQPLGNGMNYVAAMAIRGSDLYIAGRFTTPFPYLAKWNGFQFSAVGDARFNAPVLALAFMGSTLYVGGEFTLPYMKLAKYSFYWSGVGSGTSNAQGDLIATLTPGNGTDIYIGGIFSKPFASITKWNGTSFSGFAEGNIGQVDSIAVNGSDIFIGTYSPPYLKKWNGSWWELPNGPNGIVHAMVVVDGYLIIAGRFTNPASGIAMWDGEDWYNLGENEIGNQSISIALDYQNSIIYLGGFFESGNYLYALILGNNNNDDSGDVFVELLVAFVADLFEKLIVILAAMFTNWLTSLLSSFVFFFCWWCIATTILTYLKWKWRKKATPNMPQSDRSGFVQIDEEKQDPTQQVELQVY